MAQTQRCVRSGPRPRGHVTEEGRKNQVASRLTYGVRSNIPVLAGIEDPLEWERLRNGMFEVWCPVGVHEKECVEQIADGYWRLRRIRRCLTETTLTQLYEAAAEEPEEVRTEIARASGCADHSVLGLSVPGER